MAMFHRLTNVQSGEAVPLQQIIKNYEGNLHVGLRSITFAYGLYNVHNGQSLSWKSVGSSEETARVDIAPGLYSFGSLVGRLSKVRRQGIQVSLKRAVHNGLVKLIVPPSVEVRITDGILELLGLDDGLDGTWLQPGTYTGDRAINVRPTNALRVCLEEINSTYTTVDGAPTTVLSTFAITEGLKFGDVKTTRFECPDFIPLQSGTILNELTVIIRDDRGEVIDNHGLPISVVLEFHYH